MSLIRRMYDLKSLFILVLCLRSGQLNQKFRRFLKENMNRRNRR